ncbi:hypothetical protein E8E13_004582 [Curvularia kusanoi]|uniref:Uncharacterized protein n=1 Tax=Curvularia kusanoi TaxID=90978 RepID=A0A9P4TJV3_CURKU|nr:hypothetical protein E8E13_004582 [Curvularia kusanoi]
MSADYAAQELLRHHRQRITALRQRLFELLQQPVHIRCIELPILISEIQEVLCEQRAYTSPGNGESIPTPNQTLARTIVPFLPTPVYREQHEAEFERSLNYVEVQNKILWSLETYDTYLSPISAYAWTCNIVPGRQWPKPLHALRLCYYMRSLGYDTYAVIETTESAEPDHKITLLNLLVADPDSEKRGVKHDHLYWRQDIATGWAIPEPYKCASRPACTLGTFSLGQSARSFLRADPQASEIPRLRGGEAAEPFRLSQAIEEINAIRAQLWRERLYADREAIDADEVDEERLIQAIRRTG